MDYNPSASFVHGILQERILEWVAFPSPSDLPDPGVKPGSPALQTDSLPTEPPGEPIYIYICVLIMFAKTLLPVT